MKKWLKKHGRWIIVTFGVLFIANGFYGVFSTTGDWKIFHIVVIIFWLPIILIYSSVLGKIFQWWEKD